MGAFGPGSSPKPAKSLLRLHLPHPHDRRDRGWTGRTRASIPSTRKGRPGRAPGPLPRPTETWPADRTGPRGSQHTDLLRRPSRGQPKGEDTGRTFPRHGDRSRKPNSASTQGPRPFPQEFRPSGCCSEAVDTRNRAPEHPTFPVTRNPGTFPQTKVEWKPLRMVSSYLKPYARRRVETGQVFPTPGYEKAGVPEEVDRPRPCQPVGRKPD